jgi:peptidoglycan/xylan/chitin deacetylase (PgdA/CDA1 family)
VADKVSDATGRISDEELDAIGKQYGFYSHFYPAASKSGRHEYPHRDMMRDLLAREGEHLIRAADVLNTETGGRAVSIATIERLLGVPAREETRG